MKMRPALSFSLSIIANFNEQRSSEVLKTSIVFTLEDKPGMLLEILNIFHSFSLNLCHIESRPTRLKEWRYYFCLTVESSGDDSALESAMARGCRENPLE